jgi:DNA-binding CsgD family transcriptional regulator/AraC-like DNA-binding protein
MIHHHAASTLLLGNVPEAIDSAERIVEAARLAAHPQSLCWALMNYGHVMIYRDVQAALGATEESVALSRTLEDNAIFVKARAVRAMVLGELGQAARCADALLDTCGGTELALIPASSKPEYYGVLVRAELARGRLREADQAARHAQDIADELGLHLPSSLAGRARAAVLLAQDNPIGAADLALASAAEAAAVGARVEAARSRTLAARALLSVGERERAVAELQATATEFEFCGATRLRDEVERELRRLGRRFHRRKQPGGTGVGTLSARELEIAQLVTARKTNREIAAELFLSEKTIETHLRNVFGKLGVSSRRAVAHVLEATRARIDA